MSLCFVNLAAAGGQSHAQAFRWSAISLLNGAKSSGVTFIGTGAKSVSLDHLIKQADSVKFVELQHLEKPVGATRFTAFYDTPTKTVYINAAEGLQTDYTRALALHEVLGALGYADKDYQVSLGLHLFNLMQPVPADELLAATDRTRLMIELYGKEKIYKNDVAESIFFPSNPYGIFENNIRAQTLLKIQVDEAFDQKFDVDHGPDGLLLNTGGSTSGVGGGGGYASFALKERLFQALQRDNTLEYWQGQKYLAQVLTTDFNFLNGSGISLSQEVSDKQMLQVLELFKASRP